MLIRFITIISLIKFLLLMISGADISTALYRSLIVFMLLFTIMYMIIFFINVIRDNPESSNNPSVSSSNEKELGNAN